MIFLLDRVREWFCEYRITAYKQDAYSNEAKSCFDRIKHDHYRDNYSIDRRCYEFPPNEYIPTPGTVYMDFSRPENGRKFEFDGFWEVIHIERLSNRRILCLLEPRADREFPPPRGCRDRRGIGTMVNCYMRKFYSDHGSGSYLDMEFRKWYSRQQRHCEKPKKRCNDCPLSYGG